MHTTTPYRIRNNTALSTCTTGIRSYWFSFDGRPWEEFDTVDLAPYFWEGLTKLRKEIQVLENPLRRYSDEDQKRLEFMVDSLIQVRRLMDDRSLEVGER